jgi:hypothetical protein
VLDWLDNLSPVFLPSPVNLDHPLNHGRLGWWLVLPGIDGGRTWYDLMGLYHATLANMTVAGTGWHGTTRASGFGQIGLNGTSSVVTAPTTAPQPRSFTFAAWIYATDIAGFHGIFGIAKSSGFRYLAIEGNAWRWLYRNLAGATIFDIGSSTGLVASTWIRVLATHNDVVGQGTLYANGVQVTQSSTGQPSADDWSNPAEFSLGGITGIGRYFQGVADDFSYWNRPLGAAEVWQDYSLSRTGYGGLLYRPLPMIRPVAVTPPPTVTTWPAAILGHL